MKFFVFVTAATVVLFGFSGLAQAKPVAINIQEVSRARSAQLTPFQLVTMAYQGYFRGQGVPGYLNFKQASRPITAQELVQKQCKISYYPLRHSQVRAISVL